MKKVFQKIRQFLELYSYAIGHYCEGYLDYDEDSFKRESKSLLKSIKASVNKKTIPRIGESVLGDNEVYYVKEICYYSWGCFFWLDEDKDRIIEEW